VNALVLREIDFLLKNCW